MTGPDLIDFLKTVTLFSRLPQADLQRLGASVREVRLAAGQELFAEGAPGEEAYVIREGRIHILKASGGAQVLLATRGRGELIGEMALLEEAPRMAAARAVTDAVVLAVGKQELDALLASSPAAVRAMLHTVTSRLRSTEAMLRHSERMAQLGVLTAGVVHELNNPAAAVQRGTDQLARALSALWGAWEKLLRSPWSQEEATQLGRLAALAVGDAGGPEPGALERSDREEALEEWLEEHDVEGVQDLAAELAGMGLGVAELEQVLRRLPSGTLGTVLAASGAYHAASSLLREIGEGARQITSISSALKSYSHLDEAAVKLIDLHQSLESTLVMLRGKLKKGVVVERQYARDLPRVQAHGGELNQVWTNLIANAAEAMEGRGRIRLRTRREGDWVRVEVEDDGPGIPQEVQPRLFTPFFTTKPVGSGTGLGLSISQNIARRHGGGISFRSRPGETVFEVRLPVDPLKAGSGAAPVPGLSTPDEEQIRDILKNTRSIAVVGISESPDRPAHTVPAELKRQGYRLYPVNPSLRSVLGETVYPDLASIPDPVDLVLVFRPAPEVPGILEETRRLGIPAMWLQEGIVHEQAAAEARAAGMIVVQDRCLRKESLRLRGGGSQTRAGGAAEPSGSSGDGGPAGPARA